MVTFREKVLRLLFGDTNQKAVNALQPKVNEINALEPQIQALTDTELQAKTTEFKNRIGNGESLDSLLAEAFEALVSASVRRSGQCRRRSAYQWPHRCNPIPPVFR